MKLTQDEIQRIDQLLSAKQIDITTIKPPSEVVVGCEFCTGNCIGSCESTCADLQESLPRSRRDENESVYDHACYACDECGGDCYGSCYQGCQEACSGACQNSCDSRCGATCEFCCEGQCGITVSSEPEGAIRKRGYDEE